MPRNSGAPGARGKEALASLLKDTGLDHARIAKVFSLLLDSSDEDGEEIEFEEQPRGRARSTTTPATATKLGLYVAEEQGILRQAYESFFLSHSGIEVVGSSGDTSSESLQAAVTAFKPGVLLLAACPSNTGQLGVK